MTTDRIVRHSGTAVWRQIEETLAAEILSGQLRGRLANETELAQRFGVNRHTVRQAAKALVERGLVEVLHGRGTFVHEGIIDYQLGRQTRFAHSLAKARRVGSSMLLESADVLAPREVAELLELPADSWVVRIDSHDVVDDQVVGVCTQYFPLPRFAGLPDAYRATGKTHLALAQFGVVEFGRRMSRVTAKLPKQDVARQLSQSSSTPILYVETVYVDGNGTPIEYGLTQFNSTKVQLVIEPEQPDTGF